MAEIRDERELIADGFERVHVELDWYDGPRAGVADVGGEPHYFLGIDWEPTAEADEYRVWPAVAAAVAWEREQWALFVGWIDRYETGRAAVDSHPGGGGIDSRYDELTALLAPHREAPDDARWYVGELGFTGGPRYRAEGTDYRIRWRPRG